MEQKMTFYRFKMKRIFIGEYYTYIKDIKSFETRNVQDAFLEVFHTKQTKTYVNTFKLSNTTITTTVPMKFQ